MVLRVQADPETGEARDHSPQGWRRDIKMVYSLENDAHTKNVAVHPQRKTRYVLEDDEILKAREWRASLKTTTAKRRTFQGPCDIRVGKGWGWCEPLDRKLFIRAGQALNDSLPENLNTYETYSLLQRVRSW